MKPEPGRKVKTRIVPSIMCYRRWVMVTVRSFGQRTAGYATAKTTYRLPNGGKAMITTAVTLNREGKVFERFMVPDTVTTEPLAAATSWLQETCQQDSTKARE